MFNLLGELINCFSTAIAEIESKPEINNPNCEEDDLAELKPIDPRNYFSFGDDDDYEF